MIIILGKGWEGVHGFSWRRVEAQHISMKLEQCLITEGTKKNLVSGQIYGWWNKQAETGL